MKRSEFKKQFFTIHTWLLKNDPSLLDKAFPRKRRYLSNKDLQDIASKYSTKTEFLKSEYSATICARRRGVFDKICSHMKNINGVKKKVKNMSTGKIFNSAAEAARSINRSVAQVSQAIRRDQLCAGIKWSYVK